MDRENPRAKWSKSNGDVSAVPQQVEFVLPVPARGKARVGRVEFAILVGAERGWHAVRAHAAHLDVAGLLGAVAVEQRHVPDRDVLPVLKASVTPP